MNASVEAAAPELREVARPVPELREVLGPSAFGGDRSRIWPLVRLNAVQDFRRGHRRTTLGWLWAVLRPLLLFGVIFMILRQLLRVGGNIPNYALMLLFNIMLYQMFADLTGGLVRSAVRRENMVRKMHFPRIVVPLSATASSMFVICVNMLIAVSFCLISGIQPRLTWLFLPFIVLGLAAFGTGFGMILSVGYVRFRDVEPAWQVTSRALFYLSPILYPIEQVPESFRTLVSMNPLSPFFELTRKFMIDGSAPGPIEAGGPLGAIVPALFIIAAIVGGFVIFDRAAPRIAEAL
jgi:ABC-2 type transport system permease protein